VTVPVAATGTGNVTTTSSTGATGLTGSKPSNVVDGDLLWAVFYHRNASGTITAPSGWTIAKTVNTNGTFCLATKPIPSASAETATTYAFSSNQGSARCLLAIGRITNADLNNVVDATGATSLFTGSTSLSLPAVTAVGPDCLLLAVATDNTSTGTVAAFTADSAMSEITQVSVNTGAATSALQLAGQALSSSGSTGTRAPTISPAAANSGGFLATIAAEPTAAATLTAGPATLTAAAGLVAYAGTELDAGPATLTADGSIPSKASATLTAGPAVLIAAPQQTAHAAATLTAGPATLTATAGYGQLNVLSGGLWQAVTVSELVAGSWT
jgi:hypothetical protein